MKIAITGASGHLGNVLCRFLLEQNHEIRAFYHSDKQAITNLPLQLVQGDVRNLSAVEKLVAGCELVFHCAAKISIHGDPDGSVKAINIEGVRNVLQACIKTGVQKIIHISSTHAVQELPHDVALTEDRPYKTETDFAYDFSKATGEQIMLAAFRKGRIQGCVLRPSSVVGPFDFKPSELGKALLDFRAEKVPVLPPGGYNFVDVRDVVNAMIAAMEKGENGEVYFLTGRYYSMQQLAALVGEAAGVKVPKQVFPYWVMQLALPFVKLWGRLTGAAPVFSHESMTALKNGHPNIDNSKARMVLGLQNRPLVDTLKDFYAWQNQQTGQFETVVKD